MVLFAVPPRAQWLPEWLMELPILVTALLVLVGLLAGLILGRISRRFLEAAGVPDSVEGTAFERSAQSLGTSTVSIVSRTLSWFVYGVTIVAVIYVFRPTSPEYVWQSLLGFIPNLFVAVLVLVVGFVVADKAELVTSERLRGVKLPEVSLLPKIIKYSVLYVVFLIALGQIGVETTALLVLLTIYVLGAVILTAVATKDLLASGAAGIYLLLNQPYAIGDEIEIGDRAGIVQEMDVFVTHLENEEAEFVVPNRRVFETGVRRERRD